MSRPLISIDGEELFDLGLVVEDVADVRDGLYTDYPLASVPGRDGKVDLSLSGQTRERRITVSGNVVSPRGPTEHAELLSRLDKIKWRVSGRRVQIVFGDDVTRYYLGKLESPASTGIFPSMAQRGVFVQWIFLCEDPRAFDVTETTVDFTSTSAQCPLGNVRVWPVLNIVGPVTDPIIIYRDAGGTERGRIEITGTVPSGVTLVVDCQTPLITLAGVPAASMLVAGTDFFALDYRDGTAYVGPYPTVAISPAPLAAQAVYRITHQ